jgi:2-keto-4-pentenoate hydratase/2-oxohepta-3-ene-1,7-dioic acid hydratase in catechol pathway
LGIIVDSRIYDATLTYAGYLRHVKSEELAHSYELANKIIPPDMLEFLQAGEYSWFMAKELSKYLLSKREQEGIAGPRNERTSFDLEKEARLHSPVPRPLSIRDFMCFRSHMENAYRKLGLKIPEVWYDLPAYFRASPLNVVGPSDEIRWPSMTEKLDFEFEFAAYIGKEGRDVSKNHAMEHIAGFSLFNDLSARDRQRFQVQVSLGPGKSKDFDTSKVFGPFLVTPDEVDFRSVECFVRFNGVEVSKGGASDMQFTWEDLIEYISQDETIHPGEVIASGTIGNGSSLEIDKWLKPGDELEFEATGFGKLRNRIGQAPPKRPWKDKY